MRVYRIIQTVVLLLALVVFGCCIKLCLIELEPMRGQTTGLEAIPFLVYYVYGIPIILILFVLALVFGLHKEKSKMKIMAFTIVLLVLSFIAPLCCAALNAMNAF